MRIAGDRSSSREDPSDTGLYGFLPYDKAGRIERLIVPHGCKSAYVKAGYAPFFFDIVEAAH